MPQFIEKPIRDVQSYRVELENNGWISTKKFVSQGRVVEKEGRKYKLMAKLSYGYSLPERIGRIALGAVAVFVTFGAGLFLSKRVLKLFTESHKVQRIGILDFTDLDNIKSIKLTCLQKTNPPKYIYEFTCVDGQKYCNNVKAKDREEFLQKYGSKFEKGDLMKF